MISNLPNLVKADVEPLFSAVVNGTPLFAKGKTKPFYQSLETHFAINIDKLNLPYYLSYLPGERNFALAAGDLTTRLDLVYIQPDKGVPSLTLGGTATINNLLVSGTGKKKDYRFISIPEIAISLGSGNLLKGEIFIDEIACHRPEVDFLHKPDGAFYLPMLIAAASETGQKSVAASATGKSGSAAGDAEKFIFKLGKLVVDGGVVTLRDERVTPAFASRFSAVNFTLENFTTISGDRAQYSMDFKSDLGETFAGSGDFALSPLAVKAHFDLQGVLLPNYVAYYQDYFAGKFKSGQVDLRGDVTLAQTPADEMKMSLDGVACKLSDCQLSTPDGKLVLDLPQFELAQSQIDFDKHACVIGTVKGDKGSLQVIRRADGSLNLTDLLPGGKVLKNSTKNSVKVQSKTVAAPVKSADNTWHLLLAKSSLRDFAVEFKDLIPQGGNVIKADQINLDLDKLGTGKNEPGDLALKLRLARRGKLSLKGAVGVDPLQVKLDINLQKFPLPVLQKYLNEYLNLTLVRGEVATKGRFSFAGSAKGADKLDFTGNIALDNLKTVDNVRAADLFAVRHLELDKINYHSLPPAFSLQKALLKGVQVNVVKEGDGRTNFAKAVKESEAPSASGSPPSAAPEKSQKFNFALKEIELAESSLNFTDQSLSPAVAVLLDELKGSVSGLSTLGEKPAEIKCSGRLNKQAPISITGSINPLEEGIFADIQVKGEGVGLTTVSPYSGKYIGHAISKGKVSFDLNYHIDGHTLKAQNAIFLDQFDFGSKVDSPDAMSLPVKMAVALLRNRRGEIDLNLPVEGDLSDPQFSLGGIIIKVFINLITKAVTSPFALIGSLAGGDGDLNQVAFAPGAAGLSESSGKRLQELAKVLYDRPGLKVEIVGRADADSDRKALQEERFIKLLQVQKFNDLADKKRPPAIADVVIEKAEFEKYLWYAYKAAPIKKEKILLLVKKIEPAKQEKLLREFVKVKDDDLLELAQKRARTVMSFLIDKGPLKAKRLFLVAPQIVSVNAGKDSAAKELVEIKIK